MFVVSASGEECIKIADFDLSCAFDHDKSGFDTIVAGKLNMFNIFHYITKNNMMEICVG